MTRLRCELTDKQWLIIEPLLAIRGCEAEALIEAIREAAAARNIWANIPNRSNRKQRFGLSLWLYRQRNLVGSFLNRIKQFRDIATRYDKDAANNLAAIKLICVRLWCNV